ncbi:N-acetylglucosamine-6-phosphate deacetylase [Gordonia effusa NBRC 100432]|uniref:N-acetylglucosamine-6-phosphate deacetylase n=1 Tax=Gordonia effusa NBRC 100432 TaxID=1077974 RepID=H0R3X8_9ACTN|nr:N-acetylglucosamine-6-phosphate deacetylase [Gordonia effusa]GAB19779.1 N-acetylglucosamine-6-phosphate deacetylase [Gordonia effusa NBRC 100432]
MSSSVISAARVVAEGKVLTPGWVETDGEYIVGVGGGDPPRLADYEFPAHTVIPGFVDMHVHGGGGHSYTDGNADEVRLGLDFHRRHGTTTSVASLVSSESDSLLEQIDALRDLVAQGEIAGIHLEGPWLSDHRCGAHDRATLRDPDPREIAEILDAASGSVVMATLAPELPGALDAVEQFASANVLVGVGHTDAGYVQVRAAIERGARVATHLFNAMRPLHHREPGPILALLEDSRVTIELVGDGVHVHPDLVSYVTATAGPDRVALVTDAMAAAGMTDGSYRLGVLDVDVTDSVARVRETGAIAGSTATMDVLFARAAGSSHESAGTSDAALLAAVAMTASTPARVLGRRDIGELAVGKRADLVIVDEAHRVERVLTRGDWHERLHTI